MATDVVPHAHECSQSLVSVCPQGATQHHSNNAPRPRCTCSYHTLVTRRHTVHPTSHSPLSCGHQPCSSASPPPWRLQSRLRQPARSNMNTALTCTHIEVITGGYYSCAQAILHTFAQNHDAYAKKRFSTNSKYNHNHTHAHTHTCRLCSSAISCVRSTGKPNVSHSRKASGPEMTPPCLYVCFVVG